ncbi:hypothetical protein M0P65_01815 [Candidatus Gracilibacteria bacterium]|nr:hypothetical protein [Candidatus Gracilibacteria bacterium]
MIQGVEQINGNDKQKANKDLFSFTDSQSLLNDFNKKYYDEKGNLTIDGLSILNGTLNIGNNRDTYNQFSKEFKSSFNIEQFRNKPNEQKEKTQKDLLLERGIEAEYGYIDQDKFGNNGKIDIKESSNKEMNSFSKMQLVDLYEICEGNQSKKNEFILAIINKNPNLKNDEIYALLIKDIIPSSAQNVYASNGEILLNKIDKNVLFKTISEKLSEIGKGIKRYLDTGISIGTTVKDLVLKVFENGEKKEQNLIQDFDKKYIVLSKGFKYNEDKSTGFSGTLIQDKNDKNNISLTIRGSDEWKDWTSNNIEFATKTKLPPQIESAVMFIEEIKQSGALKPGQKINMVGHSLGGGLAQIISLMYPDLITNTYTFNAPGVTAIEPKLDTNNEIVKSKIKLYRERLGDKDFDTSFVLNTRNKDFIGNFDDENHIGLKSGQIDGYSHFIEPLNASINEMSIEEFNEKFKVWLEKIDDKNRNN